MEWNIYTEWAERYRGTYHKGLTVGESLRLTLDKWGMSIKQFSEFTGIERSLVSRYCNNKRIPTEKKLIIIDCFIKGGFDDQLRKMGLVEFSRYLGRKPSLIDDLFDNASKGEQANDQI